MDHDKHMRMTVHLDETPVYDIVLSESFYELENELITLGCKDKKLCIVTDTNVAGYYLEEVEKIVSRCCRKVTSYIFPAGEENKNLGTVQGIYEHLIKEKYDRKDFLIALGGGVVGDLAGFAASCYLRGIRFIQVPTTLLAAVDSSVGGKTAIDLPAGKNLAGAFCQPSLVLCDTDTLNTLPEDIFRDGCAEVIKYAILYESTLFDALMADGLLFDREAVIKRCVEWKRDVVMEDEFDTGCRMKLNLGHTIGHGVEANSDFSISHGHGVSIGMAIVTRSAAKAGICDTNCCRRILDILNRFRLPVHTDFNAEDLFACTLSDKKRTGNTIQLIIPREIGCCEIMPMPIDELKSFIEAGL